MGGKVENDISKAAIGINLEHTRVHEGLAYTAVHYDSDVDIAIPKWIAFTTPDTSVRAHMKIQIDGSGEYVMALYETVTDDWDGAAVVAINNKRDSSNTSALVFKVDSGTQVSAGGTTLFQQVSGANNNKTKVGGTARNGAEWILAQNTKYAVEITVTANATKVSVVFEWYEAN